MTQVPTTTPTEPGRSAEPAEGVALPERDVRRKRPPALSFVLRMETMRRFVRVASLLALDFLGVYLAVASALGLKALLRGGFELSTIVDQTKDFAPFAFLVMALLFARSNLYGERAARPGLSAIISCLFQVTLIALIFTLANGDRFSSYYIFYGSLFFGIVWVASLRWGYEQVSGSAVRSSSAPARTSSRSRTRCARPPTRRSTWSASSRSSRARATGCARSGRWPTCRACSTASACRRSSSPTPTSRRRPRSSSSTSATSAA